MDKNSFAILHHVAIQTANFEKAVWFYHHLLGFEFTKEPFSYKGKREMAWFDCGNIQIELFTIKSDTTPEAYNDQAVGPNHLAFEVKDIYLFFSSIREKGVRVVKEPFLPATGDPNQALVGFIEGPDGEEIEIRGKEGRTDLGKEE